VSIGRPENHRFIGKAYRMLLAELGGTVTVTVLMYDGRKFYVQDGIGYRTTIAVRRLERMVDRGAAQEVGRP
jgi:hypothetical protein